MIAFAVSLPIYLFLTLLIAAFENSGRYVEVAAVTVGAVLVLEYMMIFPGRRAMRLVEQWAAGHDVDRASALEGTYIFARRSSSQMVWGSGIWAAVLFVVVGAIVRATGWRLVQYGILGAVVVPAIFLLAYHNIAEAILRPARIALVGDTGIGDSLPRSRPSFAARSNVSMIAAAFTFAVWAALLAAVIAPSKGDPRARRRDRIRINGCVRGADLSGPWFLTVFAAHS